MKGELHSPRTRMRMKLADIQDMLPDCYRLTLVAHNVENEDANVVMHDGDDPEKVIAAIRKVIQEEKAFRKVMNHDCY